MKKVLYIVDSHVYIASNCFQHQLYRAVHEAGAHVTTLTLDEFLMYRHVDRFDVVISALKQRSIDRNLKRIKGVLAGKHIRIYDQDPWNAFIDGQEWKGAYDRFCNELNLHFYITTQSWVDKLQSTQTCPYPVSFVRMWVLPQYVGQPSLNRQHELGFIGTVHPHRKALFDQLATQGVNVSVLPGGQSYDRFLATLDGMKTFIHAETYSFTIDGSPSSLSDSLWIKDVEAIARGAFAIRNRGIGFESYDLDKLGMLRLYDDPAEIPGIIESLRALSNEEHMELMTAATTHIREANYWAETARSLIG